MRLIDADALLEWILGQCKSPSCPKSECAFGIRIMKHIDRIPSAQSSPIWHETDEDDPESFPDDDRTVLVSFENFSQPMLGQWRFDPDIGAAWYIGDTDETFIENDLFVDGWWELPRKPEVKG